MVQSLQNFDKEREETQELEKFFGVMKQFNNYKRLPKKTELKIIEFFNYQWTHDRNFFIKTE